MLLVWIVALQLTADVALTITDDGACVLDEEVRRELSARVNDRRGVRLHIDVETKGASRHVRVAGDVDGVAFTRSFAVGEGECHAVPRAIASVVLRHAESLPAPTPPTPASPSVAPAPATAATEASPMPAVRAPTSTATSTATQGPVMSWRPRLDLGASYGVGSTSLWISARFSGGTDMHIAMAGVPGSAVVTAGLILDAAPPVDVGTASAITGRAGAIGGAGYAFPIGQWSLQPTAAMRLGLWLGQGLTFDANAFAAVPDVAIDVNVLALSAWGLGITAGVEVPFIIPAFRDSSGADGGSEFHGPRLVPHVALSYVFEMDGGP